MRRDPYSGEVFIFMNRARTRIKLLHWEPGGMVIYSKMLESGTFGRPSSIAADSPAGSLEWRELVLIVEGIMENPDGRRQRLDSLRKSEKNLPVNPLQLNLFETETLSAEEQDELDKAVAEQEQTITRTITVSKPARKPIDTTKLPVEEINIYPEGTTTEEGTLKEGYIEIGTEETSRIETVPAKVYVVKTIRHKVMLKSDATDKYPEERKILTPVLPLVPINKCIAGASVLADIIINKFMYHLPFYRQIQQYREYGVSLNDSTVGGWYEAAVEKLKLLYDLLRQKILSSEYIQVDESVIPVLDDEKHKAKKGYEWCVRDGLTGNVMFYYDRGSRSGRVARELLGN